MQIEKLEPHLQKLPKLMDYYQKSDPVFPDAAIAWLDEVEKTMSSLRLHEGSELNVLRGCILKATDSLLTREERPSRNVLRASRNAAAAQAIERAEEIIRSRILESKNRLQQHEDKLCEGMTALLLQLELPACTDGLQVWLNQIWRLLQQQESTKALAIYLAASLSMVDRLYILNRVMANITEPELGSNSFAQLSSTILQH